MAEKINLLIVGRTGSGKSTLANVLCGIENGFEENENSDRNRSIKNPQKKDFVWGGTKYFVVDIGNTRITRLTEKKDLYKLLAKGICLMPEGISQVLFVVDERFTEEKIQKFKKVILQSRIVDYVTIVRTRFSNFKCEDKCNEDRKQLKKTMDKIAKSCKGGIVYVDTPPTNIISPSDDDDRNRIKSSEIRRKNSRTILLSHLKEVCQQGNYYKLNTWNELRTELEGGDNSPEVIESIFEKHLKSELPALFKTKLNTKSTKNRCLIL